ncbi:MAG: hypothetical protein SFX18_00020 [Pirellulales bacterium]|nr:hypothetical protein [Pirellulales bacterium]
MSNTNFSPGWNEERVRQLIAELDTRTDEQWIAADEVASEESAQQTVITVPAVLLPEIRNMLARHKSA